MATVSRSTKVSGGTTLQSSTVARAIDVETDMLTLFNAHNNHDAGTSKWTVVSALNASACPLIADNSSGTNDIAEFKDNGTTILTVADGGIITHAPGGTIKFVANSSGLTFSNSAKITGLPNATGATDASAFGQLKVIQIISSQNSTAFTTTSNTFQTTNCSASITPTSSSNKIYAIVTGCASAAAGGDGAFISIFRGSTNLGAGADTAIGRCNSTAAIGMTLTVLDSPASVLALTYSVKICNDDNSRAVSWNTAQITTIVLMEVAA